MMLNTISKEITYIAIKELNQDGYEILALFQFAGIARSAYYKWLNRKDTKRKDMLQKKLN